MGLYSIMGAYTIVAARDVSNVHKGVPTLANVYYRTGVNAEAAIRTLLDELFNMADHRGYHAWLRKQDVRIISCYQGMYADLKDTKKGTGVEDYTITVALDIEEDHPSVFVTEYVQGNSPWDAWNRLRWKYLDGGWEGKGLSAYDIRLVTCFVGKLKNLA
jgi:hypothetical protein